MKLAKDMAVYTGTSLVEKSVPFLLLPVLTRMLTPEEYGVITLFMAVVTLLLPVIGLSLAGYIRVVYHKETSTVFAASVGNVMALFLISFLAIFLLSFAAAPILAETLSLEPDLIFYSVAAAGLQFIVLLRLTIYQTARKPMGFALLQLLRAFLDLAFVWILLVILHGNAESRIHAYFYSFFLCTLFAIFLLSRDGLLRIEWSGLLIKRALRFSLPIIPHSIALAAVFSLDKMIISSSPGGFSMLGVLGVAVALSSPTLILANSINRAFMPWSFEKFSQKNYLAVVAASYTLFVLMTIVCVAYSAVLWWGFTFIVDERYLAALEPAILLTWIGWLKLIYLLVAKGLVFSEKMKLLPLISLPVGGAYLLGVWWLVSTGNSVQVLSVCFLILGYHSLLAGLTAVVSQRLFYQPWFEFSSAFRLMRNNAWRFTP